MDDSARSSAFALPAALAGRVDVGVLRLGTCDLAPWTALLDPAERQRSANFVHGRDSERFCLGRGLLRAMLGKAMDRPPVSLSFEVGPHGKPRIAGAQTHAFNVSHSGDYVMVAVARARAIGVDIERHRADLDLAPLSRMVLTTAEIRSARGQDGKVGKAAFFRNWVLKEAVLKAMGTGFSLDPLSIEIQTTPGSITATVSDGDGLRRLDDWKIVQLDAPGGYSAALALWP